MRPMVVAHRGDTSHGATENSLQAIAEAIATGADMIEIDVQWTKDEVFVCYHDESVKLPDGRTIPLHELSLEELSQAGVTDLLGEPFQVTPLLSVLELAGGKIYLNLEIKEYSSRDPRRFVDQLRHVIDRMGLTQHVLFSSFRVDYIRETPWTIPSCIIQPSEGMMRFFATRSSVPGSLPHHVESLKPSELMAAARATTYACMLEELNENRVRDIKSRNLHLSVYTVTTDDEFRQAVELGAKALVCEQPSHFVKLRDKLFHSS